MKQLFGILLVVVLLMCMNNPVKVIASPVAEDDPARDWLRLIEEKTGLIASEQALSPACHYDVVYKLYLCPEPKATTLSQRDQGSATQAEFLLRSTGLLLIPDSTNDRIMAFDPTNGNLVDANFIPADTTNLSTPIHAILSAGGNSILVSDQIRDVVQEYDLMGNFLGTFAPAGGVNNAILDNIRGIALRPNGNLLVTVADGANANAVAEFNTSGNYLGNFVASGSGGLGSPFGIYRRSADWLVGGSDSDAIHRYDLTGAYLANLTTIDTFPEQIAEARNGNVLVANFFGTQEGVMEFTAAGALVGIYNPAAIGGYRGVYELPNGNILTTTGTGVYEINRAGNLVETKISGVSARFIEYLPPINLLYNNGPMITHPTGGFEGNAASALQNDLGMNTLGFGAQISNGNSVADDFTVTGDGWTITEMHFFAYQTGSTTASTLNDLRIQIYDGPPNAGGTVIWGDLTTNRLTSTSWTNIYRANITDLTNTQRPIMRAVAQLATPISLGPGTYWVEYQIGGTLASGPWVPPITILGQTTTGNALQKTSGGWANALDTGTSTQQGFPFLIFGYSRPSTLRMAVKGSTNNNIYIRKMSGGVWDPWETISGATSHAPAMAEFNNRLYLAVKGATNNNLHLRYMDNTGAWSTWSTLPGGTTLSPALKVFNNRLYLFVKGATNNNIYYRSMDTAGSWSSWLTVTGGATSHTPALVVFEDELWLFVKGATNNNIYLKRMDTLGIWSPWEPFESGATSVAPAVVTYNGHAYLFVKGATNNNLYYIRDGWASWVMLSGTTTRTPSLSVNPEDGMLYIAVKGAANNNIYYRTMNSGGTWSSWFTMTGATSDTPVLGVY